MKAVNIDLNLQAEIDDNGVIRYMVVCLKCLKTFGPQGEYPDDHAQVWDDIIKHECHSE